MLAFALLGIGDAQATPILQGPIGRLDDTMQAIDLSVQSRLRSIDLVIRNQHTQHFTSASTVADALTEFGVHVAPDDYVNPAPATPLVEGMSIEYRRAIPVTVVLAHDRRTIRSSAATVADLLRGNGINYSNDDRVFPKLDARPYANMTIRVARVQSWTQKLREAIGYDGLREITVRFRRAEDGTLTRNILASRILRAPQADFVAEKLGEYVTRFARSAMTMIATAYTPQCDGCSGIAALGIPARHGVVAVDPRVIPLGTKLYIPGYGTAIAADTGSAIIGSRIDLCFTSYADAIQFGRRPIRVYVLN